MDKYTIICLSYCNGCDVTAFYMEGEYIGYVDHVSQIPDILQKIEKNKTYCRPNEIYSLRLDGLDEEALEKFHNRENKDLTISEQFAIMTNDIERLQKLWRENK